ncbi:phosphate signaling complex protein PhoU [Candidimonas nitroreducens]|uniref:Phosphate-specific transport system accessory protein PhoU n=1 Tax=Candidimonas nitroreducens TaxID=683354 RepID=A0A225M870_9BURK|nr:phosphate signaling complex protein PhoU [Candidimonas nitroreducens]OWT56290.1 phosphate transport system regulatory protein PhoU [Candidimonas nitroreducens]
MSEHTNKQFDADLEAIRTLFLSMGGVVEAMVSLSMLVLAEGREDQVERVRAREREVNRLEVEIDERIGLLIARQQPAAIDLRLLLSVSKMLTDMERCGDEAKKIAKTARRLHESTAQPDPLEGMDRMASRVTGMLRDVLDAFARQDTPKASSVLWADEDVDQDWKACRRNAIEGMAALRDPAAIAGVFELVFIARSLERIGDHAKNMAEQVIYLVHGADVRHTGLENAARLVRGE